MAHAQKPDFVFRRNGRAHHELSEREMHAAFWWVHLIEGDQLEDLDFDGRIVLKWTLHKEDRKACAGSGSG